MILTGEEIIKQVNEGNIYISNFDPSTVGPNSYDVTLNNKLLIYNKKIENGVAFIDSRCENSTDEVIIPDDGLILYPGTLYLGRTNEFTETHGFAPMIEGRSSIGRMGIAIHATAGFGDNGFKGYWTLEIFVIEPVKIYPNMRIGQLYYHTLLGDTNIEYRGKYYDNNDVQASRLYKDFD